MNYLMTVEAYGRHETKIDLNRFVADLAKELGGKVCKDPERDFGDQSHIVLGTERLDFYANNYGSKGRVRVSIWAPDVKHDERGHYNDKCKTVTATVNPNGRTMAAIAKDIKKRVVDGSQEALRLQREYAENVREGRADIKRHATKLQQSTGISVTVNESERSAAVYWNNGGLYVSGTLHADATVSIDRIGSIPVDRFEAMMFVLKGGNQ